MVQGLTGLPVACHLSLRPEQSPLRSALQPTSHGVSGICSDGPRSDFTAAYPMVGVLICRAVATLACTPHGHPAQRSIPVAHALLVAPAVSVFATRPKVASGDGGRALSLPGVGEGRVELTVLTRLESHVVNGPGAQRQRRPLYGPSMRSVYKLLRRWKGQFPFMIIALITNQSAHAHGLKSEPPKHVIFQHVYISVP